VPTTCNAALFEVAAGAVCGFHFSRCSGAATRSEFNRILFPKIDARRTKKAENRQVVSKMETHDVPIWSEIGHVFHRGTRPLGFALSGLQLKDIEWFMA